MPEGDTIRTVAGLLRPGLVGQSLIAVDCRRLDCSGLVGRRVLEVSTKGKHLSLELSGGWCLSTHLGLYGSWHRYRPRESWQKPRARAGLVIAVPDWVYVCFSPREVSLCRCEGFAAGDRRRRLGPDLARIAPAVLSGIHARAVELADWDTPLVDLLLDQRIACGIGNVFKSEVLYVNRCSPRLRLRDLTPAGLEGLYTSAAVLIQRNLHGGPRVTREARDGRGHLWVYGRRGLPCLACGAPIERALLGRNPRSTYWCPRCQDGAGPGGAIAAISSGPRG